MKRSYILTALFLTILSACQSPSSDSSDIWTIIPYPVSLQAGVGQFELSAHTQLYVEGDGLFDNEENELQNLFQKALGHKLPQGKGKNTVMMRVSDTPLPAEGYEMEVTSSQVTLTASDASGMFHAIQTLRQMLPAEMEEGHAMPAVTLPAVRITDYPAFEWRGMNLDVSRHFFSVDYLKRHIDRLALYKFNKLHLHLTDDQGWRIEIKKYPELVERGAWREFNRNDSTCMERAKENPDFEIDTQHMVRKDGKTLYGGYYTQDDIRELVRYAATKHIEIIPEVDMPGHMMAATSVYPRLSSTGKPEWGNLFSSPLDVCNEDVYSFVEDILSEVTDLFPSKYIHIGADEVDKAFWTHSPSCKRFMKEKNIQDENGLQTYFVERVQKFLASKGRETIAWDEVLEGGINPDVNVLYWRTWVASVPEKAVGNGNHVIIGQGDPLYFSHDPIDLYDIYHFKVIRETIPADKAHLVRGAHASLWTETTPSERRADVCLFPRLMALAEVTWSPDAVKDWDSFKYRLNKQLPRLDALGIHYNYQPAYTLIPVTKVDTVRHQIAVTFESERYRPQVYYTTDGTDPTTASLPYKGTFHVSGSALVRAAIFVDGQPQEILSLPVDYHKAIGKSVTYRMPWNPSYVAGGADALTNGYRGSSNYNDGCWQGFTTNLDVTIDMGELTELSQFSATFMQQTGPGIYMPDDVEVSLSDDGSDFKTACVIPNDVPKEESRQTLKDFNASLAGKAARYIRVIAHNPERRFIFVDEIIIK